ncbi:MAG: sigma 54-dependent Fis family transcriptional regulator [Myxococcales bacterium]|nr:sigma 54-dependent Fis family transcriptional regulator [Myxococcales bacterium]
MPDPFRDPSSATIDTSGGASLRIRKIRAEVIAGPCAGRVVEVAGAEVRVGSSNDNDLVLEDPAVSRHHLTLKVDSIGVRVVDAGSRNGTTLDGTRIRDAYARPDSSIVVGGSTLRLRMLEDFVDLPLSERDRLGGMVGSSVAMRRLFALLERVAPTDDPVLVEGETGTGKELAAEALHEESTRSSGPFIVLDCAAITPNLIESELFGHVKGAFTGAVSDRAGAFEQADGGTLFIDELGELPLALQPRLLRALERQEVRRLGSNTTRRVDVRVVAATNRSLSQEVARGNFREDLYYRIAVLRVVLPPLRERAEDIPLLVTHFCAQQSGRSGRKLELPARVVDALGRNAWPGNVRELRNAVARALSLGTTGNFTTGGAATDPRSPAVPVDLDVPFKVARERVTEAFEQSYLKAMLEMTDGNISRAAELAGVDRKLIQRAVKRYGLRGDRDDS